MDAQVVLSWLLSEEIKTKNQFAKNRVKDIHQMIKNLKENHSFSINFKYVPSELNPADMITRGLSYEKFQQNIQYWLSGPEWLNNNPVIWPTSELNCLSSKQKSFVCATYAQNATENKGIEPIVPFECYSSLNKLINVTASVFQVINVFRERKGKEPIDIKVQARLHLFSVMQQQCFPEELAYLQSSQGTAPTLMKKRSFPR